MRKQIFLGFFSFVFLTSLRMDAAPVSSLERKMRLENEIVGRIYADLDRVVSRRWYHVTANATFAKTKQIQVQQTLQGTMPRKGAGNEQWLPGFDIPLTEGGLGLEGGRASSTYEYVDELKSLSLTLLLQEGIPQDQEDIIRNYLQDRWVKPDPEVVTLEVRKASLIAGGGNSEERPRGDWRKSAENAWERLKNLEPISWVIVVLLLVLFAAFVFKRKSPVEASRVKESSTAVPESSWKEREDEESRESFLQELTSHPILGRGYLQGLKKEEQSAVLGLFKQGSIRETIRSWMGFSEDEAQVSADAKPGLAAHYLSDLRTYKGMRRRQQGLPLGFLADLSEEELRALFEGESSDTLMIAMRFLPRGRLGSLLAHYDLAEQTCLVDQIRQSGGVSEESLVACDGILRRKYEALESRLLLRSRSPEEAVESLLEASPHASAIARKMLEENPALHGLYKKYLLEFSDLFKMESDRVKKILDLVDNETILCALQGSELFDREKIYGCLSKERVKFLSGLEKSVGRKISGEDIQKARAMMTRVLREVTNELSANSV